MLRLTPHISLWTGGGRGVARGCLTARGCIHRALEKLVCSQGSFVLEEATDGLTFSCILP